jgi:hypothetical protein
MNQMKQTHMRKTVYAAGPISGRTWAECTGWRNELQIRLAAFGIDTLTPLRNKSYLAEEPVIEGAYEDTIFSNQRFILARDYHDATTCNLIFANLLGVKRITIGSIMEISWGYMARTPVVLLIEDEGNPHDHCMIREACPFRTNNMDTAIEMVRTILLPDTNMNASMYQTHTNLTDQQRNEPEQKRREAVYQKVTRQLDQAGAEAKREWCKLDIDIPTPLEVDPYPKVILVDRVTNKPILDPKPEFRQDIGMTEDPEAFKNGRC